MVSLNKDNQTAIDYVTNFIADQWQEDAGRYIGIGFGDGPFNKGIIKGFCLEEQQNTCCYCSRVIENNADTELEHIIPLSVQNDQTLLQYFDFSAILAENVRLQEVFRASAIQQNTPPFPHHIAYHNIVASCNGRTFITSEDFTCCNRNRSDSFIPPLNLMENSIAYDNDGTMVYIKEIQNRSYLNTLNLNKRQLKDIRRLWFLFSKSNVTLAELVNANNEDEYQEMLTIYVITNPLRDPSDNRLFDTFTVESAWNIFIDYKYFLNFFRQRY